jgi:hypothetical protein
MKPCKHRQYDAACCLGVAHLWPLPHKVAIRLLSEYSKSCELGFVRPRRRPLTPNVRLLHQLHWFRTGGFRERFPDVSTCYLNPRFPGSTARYRLTPKSPAMSIIRSELLPLTSLSQRTVIHALNCRTRVKQSPSRNGNVGLSGGASKPHPLSLQGPHASVGCQSLGCRAAA